MRRTPALILGGGPAGAAAGIALARRGIRPLLIERTRETGDVICGGFLSWRSLETLTTLGVDEGALNRERVTRLRLFAGRRMAESPLPRPAIGVTRRRLDSLLLAHAAATGVQVERGVAVRALEDGEARLADGATLSSDAVLLATGKHDLRGVARPAAARGDDPTLGLRVRLASTPAVTRMIGDAIELHLFDRGYAGVVRHEDGTANLCMAVHRSRLDEAGSPSALLTTLAVECPALGERLAEAPSIPGVDAIANVPYGWYARDTAPGVYRLGDQAGVIPSLAGEGMGIALASGIACARFVSEGGARMFQHNFSRQLARPLALAGLVRSLAEHPWRARRLVDAARIAPSLSHLVGHLTRISHSPVDAGAPGPHISGDGADQSFRG